MSFTGVSFLFAFLPALLTVYYLLPARLRAARNLILLGASLFFYAWAGPVFLPLLLGSAALNYLAGLLMAGGKNRRRAVLVLAVFCNFALLGWFKYAGFFAGILNGAGLAVPIPKIVLPLGISFFTFQAISYVVDVYRGAVPAQKNPLWVALYLSFFPRLVAGPIARYPDFRADLAGRREGVNTFVEGAVRFLFGMAKKLLLANSLALVANAAYATKHYELSTAMAWLGAAAYTLQIYLDFSAYSDMAIGMGRMFGFHFPENFDYPYTARSITEFWRRWHITLSSWFRDYVYIPLGGSRCALPRQLLNLLIVWCLTGFWHGAAWSFVAWGFYYAVVLMGERYLWGKAVAALPSPLRRAYTLFLVLLGWVLFRAGSAGQIAGMLGALFGLSGMGLGSDQALYFVLEYRWELAVGLIACLPVKRWLAAWLERRQTAWGDLLLLWGPRLLALLFGAFALARMVSSGFNPFIYANF